MALELIVQKCNYKHMCYNVEKGEIICMQITMVFFVFRKLVLKVKTLFLTIGC